MQKQLGNSTYKDIRIGKCYDYTDVIWTSYMDGVGVIDLTEIFGAGNEPNQEWCDRHINYFDGTTTTYK